MITGYWDFQKVRVYKNVFYKGHPLGGKLPTSISGSNTPRAGVWGLYNYVALRTPTKG